MALFAAVNRIITKMARKTLKKIHLPLPLLANLFFQPTLNLHHPFPILTQSKLLTQIKNNQLNILLKIKDRKRKKKLSQSMSAK